MTYLDYPDWLTRQRTTHDEDRAQDEHEGRQDDHEADMAARDDMEGRWVR